MSYLVKKTECVPYRIRKKREMFKLPIFINHCGEGSTQFKRARKRNKFIQPGKEAKLSLVTDNIILYVENTKESTN